MNMRYISPYNPSANGKCEKLNGIIKKLLAIIASINKVRKPERHLLIEL